MGVGSETKKKKRTEIREIRKKQFSSSFGMDVGGETANNSTEEMYVELSRKKDCYDDGDDEKKLRKGG